MKSYEPESFRVLDREIRALGCIMEKIKKVDTEENKQDDQELKVS